MGLVDYPNHQRLSVFICGQDLFLDSFSHMVNEIMP
jgi:hypothetical protein